MKLSQKGRQARDREESNNEKKKERKNKQTRKLYLHKYTTQTFVSKSRRSYIIEADPKRPEYLFPVKEWLPALGERRLPE